jgi:uncharacterized protein YcbX
MTKTNNTYLLYSRKDVDDQIFGVFVRVTRNGELRAGRVGSFENLRHPSP